MKEIEKMAKNIYKDMQQENTDKVEKQRVINLIEEITIVYGSFSAGEVEAEYSPTIPSKGNLVHLIEYFNSYTVDVEVYESGGSNEIDNYELTYEELELPTLKYILELAEQFKKQEIQNLKDDI
jgi:hypothetical protein